MKEQEEVRVRPEFGEVVSESQSAQHPRGPKIRGLSLGLYPLSLILQATPPRSAEVGTEESRHAGCSSPSGLRQQTP